MTPSQDVIWSQILKAIEQKIGAERFGLWLGKTKFISLNNDVLKIGVPNLFIETWLEERLLEPISEAVEEALSQKIRVEFVIDGSLFRSMRKKTEEQVKEFTRAARKTMRLGLNDKMTLERFIKGRCNKLAYLSANKAAEAKEKMYNPLFIYGSDGKTHLLQAIAHKMKKDFPDKSIIYITADRFSTDFVWALRNNKISSFRSLYRNADALIVDDVHHLSSKTASLEEFLHTLDSVFSKGNKIVVSSGVHPRELTDFKKQIVSRLSQGMLAKIEPPDIKTLQKIVDLLTFELKPHYGAAFPQNVREYIAERFSGNIRELIGAFTRLAAYVSLSEEHKKQLTITTAKAALGELLGKPKEINLAFIAEKVAKFFGIPVDSLIAQSRKRSTAIPRQICIWLARRLTNASLADIGRFYGKRTHSAALFSDKKINSFLTTDASLKEVVTKLETTIKAETE
ncbi:MAG: chromosomal replication initiator protein DnaA [Planctomycetota bacterium]